jgi:hypothetical protein
MANENYLKHWNVEVLKSIILAGIQDIESDTEDLYLEDEWKSIQIEELSSGRAGIYQSKEVIEMFELEDEAIDYLDGNIYKPEIWEEFIEPYMTKVSDFLEEQCKDALKEHYHLSFSNMETDGSYGLNLSIEIEKL